MSMDTTVVQVMLRHSAFKSYLTNHIHLALVNSERPIVSYFCFQSSCLRVLDTSCKLHIVGFCLFLFSLNILNISLSIVALNPYTFIVSVHSFLPPAH